MPIKGEDNTLGAAVVGIAASKVLAEASVSLTQVLLAPLNSLIHRFNLRLLRDEERRQAFERADDGTGDVLTALRKAEALYSLVEEQIEGAFKAATEAEAAFNGSRGSPARYRAFCDVFYEVSHRALYRDNCVARKASPGEPINYDALPSQDRFRLQCHRLAAAEYFFFMDYDEAVLMRDAALYLSSGGSGFTERERSQLAAYLSLAVERKVDLLAHSPYGSILTPAAWVRICRRADQFIDEMTAEMQSIVNEYMNYSVPTAGDADGLYEDFPRPSPDTIDMLKAQEGVIRGMRGRLGKVMGTWSLCQRYLQERDPQLQARIHAQEAGREDRARNGFPDLEAKMPQVLARVTGSFSQAPSGKEPPPMMRLQTDEEIKERSRQSSARMDGLLAGTDPRLRH